MLRPVVILLALTLATIVACAPPAIEAPIDETKRPLAVWLPASGEPWAQVVAVHGFNDRKQAFAGFGTFAAARGVLVYAYDQPGFGARADRGTWPGATELARELDQIIRARRALYPDIPLYVVAESMGAAVAATTLGDPNAPRVDGLVMASPAVWGGNEFNPLYRGVLFVVSTVLPDLKLTGARLGRQSSDNIPMLIRLGEDPLFITATRTKAIQGLVDVMDAARNAAPRLSVRMLVLLGARDEIVPQEAQTSFTRDLRASDCLAARYPEGWHMLLRDLEAEFVWGDILAWMEGLPPPSGLTMPCVALPEPALDGFDGSR